MIQIWNEATSAVANGHIHKSLTHTVTPKVLAGEQRRRRLNDSRIPTGVLSLSASEVSRRKHRYEGHSLCLAIWFFNNTYNHSVYSSFFKTPPPPPPSACTHLTILSNQLSMTPGHVDWGMSKMTPSKNARASSAF